MTTIAKPFEIAEYEFPDTGAEPTKDLFWQNGHIINFINDKSEPDACFIREKNWDAALDEFEGETINAIIISHYPAIMVYDF